MNLIREILCYLGKIDAPVWDRPANLSGDPHNDIVISSLVKSMAQLIVRNLEEDVKARLRRLAERHGHSMEEEVRDILRNAVGAEKRPATPLGSRLRQRFERVGLDEEIKELHGQKARPTVFEG